MIELNRGHFSFHARFGVPFPHAVRAIVAAAPPPPAPTTSRRDAPRTAR